MDARDRDWLEQVLVSAAADGEISAEQADVLRARAARVAGTDRGAGPVAVEALGYVGGAIALAGAVLTAGLLWDDLATGWRIAVLAAGTVVPLGAGAVVPAGSGGAGARLRSVLWAVSLGSFAGLVAVLGDQPAGLAGRDLLLAVASSCAAYAFVLFRLHRAVLQQALLMVAVAVTAAAVLHRTWSSPDLPGLGAWGTGLLWMVLGRLRILLPVRLALAAGAAMMIVGSMLTAGADAGLVLVLVTVLAVIVAALLLRDLVLLGVGAAGAVLNLPGAVSRWFPDSVAVSVGLVILGLALVVTAARLAVRREPAGARRPKAALRERHG